MQLSTCLRLSCLWLVLTLFANQATAQYEKKPWPKSIATPRIEYTDLSGKTWNGQHLKGMVVILNFWATWCPPCVEEMPLLDVFYRQNSSKGWKMLGIAIDQPSQVKKFLAQRPFSYTMAHGGLDGMQLGEMLGNESGSLPFTVVLAADGRLIQRKLGKLSANELQKCG